MQKYLDRENERIITEKQLKDEYEAEYGADGAAWRRRGGSAW